LASYGQKIENESNPQGRVSQPGPSALGGMEQIMKGEEPLSEGIKMLSICLVIKVYNMFLLLPLIKAKLVCKRFEAADCLKY